MTTKITTIFIVLLFSIGFAHHARLAGMGNLTNLFQDDFNQLNLYDFAKMPAGFLLDDSVSVISFTAAGLKQRWSEDSITYWALGQVFPENLQDYAPFEALDVVGYVDIPQFSLPPCQIRYESRRIEEEYGGFGEILKPQAWGVYISYSQLDKDYPNTDSSDIVRTPELLIVYSRPLLENLFFGIQLDGFYGMYKSYDEQEEATLIPVGGGLGISYERGLFTLGINGEYHYPKFEFDYTSFGTEYTEDFSGHAISPSIAGILNFDNINLIWANVIGYKWVNLSGIQKGADTQTEIGDLEINDYLIKSQILYRRDIFRFTILGEHDSKMPIFIDAGGNKDFETCYKNYTGTIGFGIDLPVGRAGIEGEYISISTENRLLLMTTKGKDITFKAGGEVNITKDFLLRSGYNYNRFDPEFDINNDQTFTNLITYGLGFNFAEKVRLDFTYNYKWSTFENDVNEKVTDQILFLYIKYFM